MSIQKSMLTGSIFSAEKVVYLEALWEDELALMAADANLEAKRKNLERRQKRVAAIRTCLEVLEANPIEDEDQG